MAILISSKMVMFVAMFYSIFLPLRLGRIWLYVGVPITLAGIVAGIIVMVDWKNTPPDELITRGSYRFSRHPVCVSGFILFLGMGIATASWLFFLFLAIYQLDAWRPCVSKNRVYWNDTVTPTANTWKEYRDG